MHTHTHIHAHTFAWIAYGFSIVYTDFGRWNYGLENELLNAYYMLGQMSYMISFEWLFIDII